MKKVLIVLCIMSLGATMAFGSISFTDDFSTATVRQADGSNVKEVRYSDYSAATDAWHTCHSFGWEWILHSSGGNPDECISKRNNNQSVISSAWRIFEDNQATTGLMTLEFDYKFTAVDGWDEAFGVSVWGITSDGTPEWNGYILAQGGGNVHDALSYMANDGETMDGTQLMVQTSADTVPAFTSDDGTWRSASFTVDLGAGYDYVMIGFAEGGMDMNNSVLYAAVDNVSFAPIPEPATLVLLGLGSLISLKRRR